MYMCIYICVRLCTYVFSLCNGTSVRWRGSIARAGATRPASRRVVGPLQSDRSRAASWTRVSAVENPDAIFICKRSARATTALRSSQLRAVTISRTGKLTVNPVDRSRLTRLPQASTYCACRERNDPAVACVFSPSRWVYLVPREKPRSREGSRVVPTTT